MEAPAMWQPQEQGLREICTLLEAHISPNSDQARIWQQLQHYSQFPDFNNYLVFLLARGEGKSIEVRQAAGLLLKNNLRTTFSSMPPASQHYVKSELLPCIGATNRAIRSTVGTVISVLFQIVRVAGWIELFQALHKCLDSNDLDYMEGAMDAIYKICEDVPEELDVDVPGLSERPINVFMPRILQFFQSPHASLRKLALGCINQYIVVMPSALYMSMDQYLQGLFSLAKDPSADVRKLVCSAWVQLIEVRPSILEIGKEIAPVVITVVSCLVTILKSPEGLNKSLLENSAITLGRLSWVCPDIVAPHMDHFMQAWCNALCMIRDDFEKEDAFHGLCAMVAANPSGAVGFTSLHLPGLCKLD